MSNPKSIPDLVLKKRSLKNDNVNLGELSIYDIDNLKDVEFGALIQNFFENDDRNDYVPSVKNSIIYYYGSNYCDFTFGCRRYQAYSSRGGGEGEGEKNKLKKIIIKFFNFLKNIMVCDFCYYSPFCDDDIVRLICDVIKNSNTIEYVCLPNLYLKDDILKILHNCMMNHKHLKHLSFKYLFSESKLSRIGFEYMNDIIKSSNIEDISGLHNDEYDYFFEGLLDNFFRGRNLNLNLKNKHIHDDLIFKLSNVMKKQEIGYLVNIDLSHNKITSKGFSMLVDSLLESKNNNIIKINMYNNGLDDEHIESLGELIKKNENMSYINLGCNDITDKGVEKLSEYIVGNTSIESIYLHENVKMTNASYEAIKHMIKSSSVSSIGYNIIANVEYMKEIKELLKIPIEEREIPLITFQNVKSASKIMKE